MEFKLTVGLSSTIETTVKNEDTAISIGSGKVEVLATPYMISLMENAALSAVALHLPSGYETVGTKIEVSHIAATPVGMKVKAVANLIGVEGKKLIFEVLAYDEIEKIGEGIHERFIISHEKFQQKTKEKLKK